MESNIDLTIAALPLPLWAYVLICVAAPFFAAAAVGAWVHRAAVPVWCARHTPRALRHRRRVAAVPADRLRATHPAAPVRGRKRLVTAFHGVWIDPAAVDASVLAAAMRRHPTHTRIEPIAAPPRFPIPDDEPAPYDDLVVVPRVDDRTALDAGILRIAPETHPPAPLFDSTPACGWPAVAVPAQRDRGDRFISGAWDRDEEHAGADR